jgi:hypothetical protein
LVEAREELLKKLSQNPRFMEVERPGEGFVIVAAKPPQPERLEDLSPQERPVNGSTTTDVEYISDSMT